MKKNWKEILLWGIILIVIIPLIMAYLLSFRLIITDTTNEWIGFWGGYLGALFGGIITLYVMYKTNELSREHIELTLENEKYLEKRREKIDFSNYVIEKMASITANVEESAFNACECKDTDKITNELRTFSKQIRITRSTVFELYMHFEVIKEENDYFPQTAIKISEILLKLYVELDEYHIKKLKNESYNEKKLFDMVNNIDNMIESYIKNLLKVENKNSN